MGFSYSFIPSPFRGHHRVRWFLVPCSSLFPLRGHHRCGGGFWFIVNFKPFSGDLGLIIGVVVGARLLLILLAVLFVYRKPLMGYCNIGWCNGIRRPSFAPYVPQGQETSVPESSATSSTELPVSKVLYLSNKKRRNITFFHWLWKYEQFSKLRCENKCPIGSTTESWSFLGHNCKICVHE